MHLSILFQCNIVKFRNAYSFFLSFFFSSCHSNERLFLRDFVSCSNGTSGGRLARWLQPDSFVDPSQCEVLYSREEMRCGWPAIVTLLTRDQYGEVVHVPGLKVRYTFWDDVRGYRAAYHLVFISISIFFRSKSRLCLSIRPISRVLIKVEKSVVSRSQIKWLLVVIHNRL